MVKLVGLKFRSQSKLVKKLILYYPKSNMLSFGFKGVDFNANEYSFQLSYDNKLVAFIAISQIGKVDSIGRRVNYHVIKSISEKGPIKYKTKK